MPRIDWQQFRDAFFHRGPGYEVTPLPRRGDAFNRWLVAHRDLYDRDGVQWITLDVMAGDYERHADTRTPLNQPITEES